MYMCVHIPIIFSNNNCTQNDGKTINSTCCLPTENDNIPTITKKKEKTIVRTLFLLYPK